MSKTSPNKETRTGRAKPNETVALLRRCRSGELEALSPFFERWQNWLQSRVQRELNGEIAGHVDAMDVVQDTNMVALRKLEGTRIRTRAGLRLWLANIASNRVRELVKYLHARKRDVSREVRLNGRRSDGDVALMSLEGPAEVALRAELRAALESALQSLSPLHREVILLRDFQGESWDRITATMDRTSKHATQELHRRAWARLRRLLGSRIPEYADSKRGA